MLQLAALATALKAGYVKEGSAHPWFGSPFLWIHSLKSRQIGKVGEQLIAGWCAAKEFDVLTTGDSEADRVIGGKRVEVKFSTLWQTGVYKFQQIRDQRYELLICLGIAPYTAHCWVLPKDVLKKHVIGFLPQHRGKAGSDTFWLSVNPKSPQDWLAPWGGTLTDALKILEQLCVRRVKRS